MLYNEATLTLIGIYGQAIIAARLAHRYETANALIVELQALLG